MSALVVDPRIAGWRAAIADGTITQEEYKVAVEVLRAGRKAAAELAAVKKKAAAGKGKRKKSTEKELTNEPTATVSNSDRQLDDLNLPLVPVEGST